jgi:hypothetical protein
MTNSRRCTLFKFILPDEIEIGIKSALDADNDVIELYFNINGRPMLQFICKQIIKITKRDITDQIKIKPEKIIINLPDLYIPYRIKGINLDEFIITLQKEQHDMANHDDKKPVNNGDKFEKAAQIGSLVLGAVLTSLQIYFTIRHSGKPPMALPV